MDSGAHDCANVSPLYYTKGKLHNGSNPKFPIKETRKIISECEYGRIDGTNKPWYKEYWISPISWYYGNELRSCELRLTSEP